MNQRNIRLLVEYDGTHFNGFQRQPGQRTVQGEIEAALLHILGETVTVCGAGRTDTGVHATGQVVTFKTQSDVPLAKLVRSVGGIVGFDLGVQAAQEMPAIFHARFSARWRQYRYRLMLRPQPSPLMRDRTFWAGPNPLDVDAMQRVWASLVGPHDFTNWENYHSTSDHPNCVVHEARMVAAENGEWHLWLTADRFLYRMVRNLVGSTVLVGKGMLSEATFADMLHRRIEHRAGMAVPAGGLTFESVGYAPEFSWEGAVTGHVVAPVPVAGPKG